MTAKGMKLRRCRLQPLLVILQFPEHLRQATRVNVGRDE